MWDLETSYSISDSDTDNESEIDYSPHNTGRWIYNTGVMDWVHFMDNIVRFHPREEEPDDSDMDYSVRSYSSLEYDSDEITDDHRFNSLFERFE